MDALVKYEVVIYAKLLVRFHVWVGCLATRINSERDKDYVVRLAKIDGRTLLSERNYKRQTGINEFEHGNN